mgnify:CR=1 FL=1
MTIRSLPPEVYMKIAAGEVVANPACVLKELVENALDAQATALTIRFQNGGIDAICVHRIGPAFRPLQPAASACRTAMSCIHCTYTTLLTWPLASMASGPTVNRCR